MDFNALVSEVVRRVAEKMDCGCDKPRLLILTPQHGEACHAMLESPRLGEYYQTECALMQEYKVCVEDYEAILLFGLTNESLCRLAGGVCDTPFTALAQKALLAGKKILVCESEVELYRYQQSAPTAYYQMLEQKLGLLTASGMLICPAGTLEDAVLKGMPTSATECAAPAAVPCATCAPEPVAKQKAPCGQVRIDKRVVTERDMEACCSRDTATVYVGERAILTDLAREFAHSRSIAIVRG